MIDMDRLASFPPEEEEQKLGLENALNEWDPATEIPVLAALAHPCRLQLVWLLLAAPGKYNVGKLAELLGVEQSTVSHHLDVLYHDGLLLCRRGKREQQAAHSRYYLVDRNRILDQLSHFATWLTCLSLSTPLGVPIDADEIRARVAVGAATRSERRNERRKIRRELE